MTTPPPPAGLTARPLTPTDLDEVYAVYAAAEIADAGHLAIEPEDLAGDWSRPSFDLAHDSIGLFENGHVVAAAAAGVLGFTVQEIEATIRRTLPARFVEMNVQALALGAGYTGGDPA